ncbi:uncharacterized protein UTRI_05934_B [Ustilago trichophora]|uniref:Structure-specific endonuclease subunit SLX4 n=1 Tax=Ustilago trichophora TaxID=86804 RepID=A0A5C3ENE6_9BASI|nr:uncharacterized protein UTRI_05934_B [Ustilago trichophora]
MPRRSTRLSAGHDASPLPIASRSYTSDADADLPSLPAHKLAGIDGRAPDFEEWPLARLQSEVKRYGFKTSRKRSTLVHQLQAVYDVMGRARNSRSDVETSQVIEPEAESSVARKGSRKLLLPREMLADSDSEGAAKSKAPGRGKGKGRKSDPFLIDVSSESSPESVVLAENADVTSGEEAGDYTLQLELEAQSATDGALSSSSEDIPLSTTASPRRTTRQKSRSLSPSSSSSSADVPLSTFTTVLASEEAQDGGGEAVDPSPALADTMTAAIRSNAGLWTRILRYEPISFDELVSLATQSGLSMDSGKRKEELRTWLDRQCICFYSAELTGSRSRH